MSASGHYKCKMELLSAQLNIAPYINRSDRLSLDSCGQIGTTSKPLQSAGVYTEGKVFQRKDGSGSFQAPHSLTVRVPKSSPFHGYSTEVKQQIENLNRNTKGRAGHIVYEPIKDGGTVIKFPVGANSDGEDYVHFQLEDGNVFEEISGITAMRCLNDPEHSYAIWGIFSVQPNEYVNKNKKHVVGLDVVARKVWMRKLETEPTPIESEYEKRNKRIRTMDQLELVQ